MIYKIGNLEFDSIKSELTGSTIAIPQKVPPRIGKLLVHFIDNKNRTVSNEELLDEIWNRDRSKMRSLYTHINDLKRMLEVDKSLEFDNVYGKGYGLKEHVN